MSEKSSISPPSGEDAAPSRAQVSVGPYISARPFGGCRVIPTPHEQARADRGSDRRASAKAARSPCRDRRDAAARQARRRRSRCTSGGGVRVRSPDSPTQANPGPATLPEQPSTVIRTLTSLPCPDQRATKTSPHLATSFMFRLGFVMPDPCRAPRGSAPGIRRRMWLSLTPAKRQQTPAQDDSIGACRPCASRGPCVPARTADTRRSRRRSRHTGGPARTPRRCRAAPPQDAAVDEEHDDADDDLPRLCG